MGSDDEFGPDTMTIRAWLDKRATYAADREVPLPPIELRPSATVTLPAAEESPRPEPKMPDTHDAGRSVLDALRPVVATPEPVAPEPEPEVRATPEARKAPEAPNTPEAPKAPKAPKAPPIAVRPAPAPAPSTYVVAPEAEDDLPPAVIEFKPRNRVQRVLSAILLVAVVLAIGSAAVAVQQRTTGLYVVTASLGVLVLVVWAVRASTTPTRLTIRRSQLEVVRSGRRMTIDLASPFTPVAVLGTPGRRDWQVLIEQLDAPVLTLTAGDVDPEPFMRVLLRLRPDLRPDPRPHAA